MKRDKTGKFTQSWNEESKRAVKLSLTGVAWQLLEQQARELGISRSEVVERQARHVHCRCCAAYELNRGQILEQAPQPLPIGSRPATPEWLLSQQVDELQQHNQKLQAQVIALQETIEKLQFEWQQRWQLPEQTSDDRQLSQQKFHFQPAIPTAADWVDPEQIQERHWLEAILNLLPTPLILVDPDQMRVTFSNQAANAMAGVDLAREVGATYNEDYHCTDATGRIIPPEELPAVRVARGEKFNGTEVNWHTPAGRFPLLVYADTIPAMHNRPMTSVIVFQDITQRKQIEEQLQASQRFIQQVADATPGILYIYDLIEQRNVYANRQVGAVLGYSAEQVQAMGDRLFPTLLHPDDLVTLPAHLEQFERAQDSEVIEREYRMRHADGAWRWLWSRDLIFARTPTGAPHQLLGIALDITERQAALLEGQRLEQTQQFLAHASQTFVAASLDLRIILETVTRLASELTGDVCVLNLLADDRQSLDHVSFYHPDPETCIFVGNLLAQNPRSVQQGISSKVMQTGEPLLISVSSEHELSAAIQPEYRRYLERFQVQSTLLVPLRQQGRSIGVLSLTRHAPATPHTQEDLQLFQDLADRAAMAISCAQLYEAEQRARAQAEAANRMKDEFLAVLSHELRTPMNPILGWSRLLRQGKLDNNKTEIALETIERNAKLQVQLIEDLLDISRILQGKLSLKLCPLSLTSVIEAALETVRFAANAKGIHIQTDLENSVDTISENNILGDSVRLQQVVWNLLANAVKFTPEGGRVSVRLDSLPRYARMTVTDTGKGISPQFLPYVFDTFRQADSSTTRSFGGLGLGLAITRHIVELHGGTIHVESLGEGQGSTFTVQLPLVPVSSPIVQEASLSNQSLTLNKIQVLAVDDELDNLELATFVLEQAGATVTAVSSAAEALQSLAETKPDLLLADIGMPQMDGYTLLQHIRALPPEAGGNIPAIALTAYAGEVDQNRALTVGFQKHLAKPIEPDELVSAVAILTSQHN